MRVITLVRKYHPTGTNGQLSFDGRLICHTIELPWRDIERSVSCIPERRYMLSLHLTSRWGWHFQILNVPDRSWMLIHPANCAFRELRGCIAPVMDLTGPGYGLRSRAMAKPGRHGRRTLDINESGMHWTKSFEDRFRIHP